MEGVVDETIAVDARLAMALAVCRTSLRSKSGEENQWRKKAKLAEHELLSVREELQELRGALVLDQLPLLAPCKCHFFAAEYDRMNAQQSGAKLTYGDHIRKTSVQNFLRNVRILRRSKQQRPSSYSGDIQGHLAMVVEFVIELSCQTKPVSPSSAPSPSLKIKRSTHLQGKYAEAYMHQAVEFIKDATRLLLEESKEEHSVADSLIKKLVSDLVGKLLNFKSDEEVGEGVLGGQEWNQLVVLKLSELAFIGHRVLLITSQEIAMVLERLLCMDPFDGGFSQIYENLFFMFELVERLLVEHLSAWEKGKSLDQGLLGEWVTCHFQGKTAIQGRCTAWTSQLLIVMDRITEKMLEQLRSMADLDGQEQDHWHKALLHLIASASSALADF